MRSCRPSVFTAAVLALIFSGVGATTAHAATRITCSSPASQHPQPTEYFVSLADHSEHLAHVSIRFTQAAGTVRLNMPVWNALYQVRNFAAHIQDVRAIDAGGRPVRLVHARLNEWQAVPSSSCMVVEYDIHLNAPGPFGAQLSTEHGFFNWAMVLMYSPETRLRPMSVQFLDVPSGWALHDVHVMGEAPAGNVAQVVGIARDYDELVDSPAEVGVFQHFQFQQDGATYHVVVHASPSDYDTAKLEETLQRITRAGVDWMADRPFDSYTFLYHFPQGYGAGGMEHAYGTAIDVTAARVGGKMLPLASVSSHEFFHLWNVKRIRPASLEPVNYQMDMDTRALWFSEGLTNTVGDILLVRAGILSERQYIDGIAVAIGELQARPAHRWQSAEDAGLDAWFEGNAFYRTPQRSISYYNKGEVLGVLLDLRIRQITNGRKSLRDLFQWMNDKYAKKGAYFPDSDGVQQAAETITGQSFGDFFQGHVSGVRELPYNQLFDFVGLQVAEVTMRYTTAGFETTANIGGQPEVTKVVPNSDAQQAGLHVGDRVLELNGQPATPNLDYELSLMREGSTVKIRVATRDSERNLKLKLAARQEQGYVLQDLPNITPEQRAHRTAWAHGDDETGGAQ